jgi:hypothetical protein
MQKIKKIVNLITITAILLSGISVLAPKTTSAAVPISTSLSTVSSSPSSLPANGTDYSTITVNIKNTTGGAYAGVTVIIASSRGTFTDSIETVNATTNSLGNATFRIKSITAGTSTVAARVGTTTITDTATVTFTAVSIIRIVSPTLSSVNTDDSSVTANGTDYATITVNIKDATGFYFSGQTVTLSYSGAPSVSVETINDETDVAGNAIYRVRSSSSGTATFTARVGAVTVIDTASVTFSTIPVVRVVSPSLSSVNTSASSLAANGTDYATITVTVKDLTNTVFSGQTVTLSSSRGALDTIETVAGTTNASGQASFRVRSMTSGISTYTAIASGMITITDTAIVTFTVVITPVPGADLSSVSASQSTIQTTAASVVADNLSSATITLTAKNSFGTALSGKTATLTSNRGGTDHITLITAGGTTNPAGQVVFTISSASPGDTVLTAIMGGVTLSSHLTINFTETSSSDPDPDPAAPEDDDGSSDSDSPSGSGSPADDPADSGSSSSPVVLNFGDLFKESSSTAVYYYAGNGKRYVFPTQAIYFSWYSNFSSIKTVTRAQITAIQLGGNVLARPGRHLVQFVSMDTPFRVMDPKVYVLNQDGQLRWLRSAEIASSLYGSNWEQKIVAVSEIYKINYGSGIAGADVENTLSYSRTSVETVANSIDNVVTR